MADSRRKLTLSAAARGRRNAARARDSWLDSEECHAAYRAKRAEAQASANATGMDHGMFVSASMRMWMFHVLPAKQYRFGGDLTCEVVYPEDVNRTVRGHGYAATRPPSVVGPDYHGGPWVGSERARELSRAWWAAWDEETTRLRWAAVARTVRALNHVLRVALAVRRLHVGGVADLHLSPGKNAGKGSL